MIPDAVVGLAILTLAWLPLWWLVGRRRPLSTTCCAVGAIAWGVYALHNVSIDRPAFAVGALLCALMMARDCGWRSCQREAQDIAALRGRVDDTIRRAAEGGEP